MYENAFQTYCQTTMCFVLECNIWQPSTRDVNEVCVQDINGWRGCDDIVLVNLCLREIEERIFALRKFSTYTILSLYFERGPECFEPIIHDRLFELILEVVYVRFRLFL